MATNLPFVGNFRITKIYREKDNRYKAKFHTGIDLVGDTNKNVYSVCDGKVIMAKKYGDYGNAIKIRDNTTGKIFLFAHLSRFYVTVGQVVSRTTKIGYMGNTGNSTAPHLHLELRTANDRYGEVENIAEYMKIPNKVGKYNSNNDMFKDKSITYQVHIEKIGWQSPKVDGQIAGTEGQSLRIEAIKISATENIRYRVHIQDKGWSEWYPNDCIAGTVGQSKRLEAIEIVTEGSKLRATAHIQDIGWEEVKEGNTIRIGTEGRALRLEALRLEFI